VVIRHSVEASLRSGVFPEAIAMSGRHRGLRFVTLLVAYPGASHECRQRAQDLNEHNGGGDGDAVQHDLSKVDQK
jgi:hypothetical protein